MAHQQTTAASAVPSGRRGQEQEPRRQLRASDVIRKISQILGELLITAGIVLLLFVGWELWWTNVEANAKQNEAVQSFAQDLTGPVTPAAPANQADFGPPVVGTAPANGETIGIMYIPRFGADYTRPIIEGTGADVLDTLGLGRYGSTSMPGAIGNFAVAGHRQTHGAVLDSIHTLVPGDKIYVQTADGFYTYVFRNNQIVLPNRTDVLMPVPTQPGIVPKERILTMTSCNPRFGSQERIIAYSVMEGWQPASAGPPSEIAAQVAKVQGKG
ncbi:class E sortase [Paenarthrobacter sp. A20]|uniref:class E sortase n=1 Tax=Paenarthrobacter sp. A20 TaxID=2817891 RepID=UPI0035A8AB36|nr:sortase A [Paenarthrobacter sp. A20]